MAPDEQHGLAGAERYSTGNPLDPGTIIVNEIVTRMERAVEAAQGELEKQARDGLLALVAGAPWKELNPRVWILFQGPAGTRVPRQHIDSRDGAWKAGWTGEASLVLRSIEEIRAVGSSSCWDVTGALRDGTAEKHAAAYAWARVEGRLSPGAVDSGFPGLAWDLPAPVSARVRSVRIAGSERELRWSLDPRGRLLVEEIGRAHV